MNVILLSKRIQQRLLIVIAISDLFFQFVLELGDNKIEYIEKLSNRSQIDVSELPILRANDVSFCYFGMFDIGLILSYQFPI